MKTFAASKNITAKANKAQKYQTVRGLIPSFFAVFAAVLCACSRSPAPQAPAVQELAVTVSVQAPEGSPLSGVTALAFSSDGKLFASAASDGTVRVWELLTAKQLQLFDAGGRQDAPGKPAFRAAVFSPGGEEIALAAGGEITVWNRAGGERRLVITTNTATGETAALDYSADGKEIIALSRQGTQSRYDAKSGKLLREESGLGEINAAALADGAGRVLYAKGQSVTLMTEAPGSADAQSIGGLASPAQSLALSPARPDAPEQAAGAAQTPELAIADTRAVTVRDAAGNTVQTLAVNALSLALSPGGKTLLSGSADGSVRLWDTASGRELASFTGFADGEWIVMTAGGYYNASLHGGELFTVQAGDDTYSMQQFSETLYRPDKVSQAISGGTSRTADGTANQSAGAGEDEAPLRALLQENPRPPLVSIAGAKKLSTADAEIPVKIKVTVREGGAGAVAVVSRNAKGKDILVSLPSIKETQKKQYTENGKTCYDLELRLPVEPGTNTLGISAFNEKHTMESEKIWLEVASTQAAQANGKPVLHVLLAAITDYKNPNIRDLKYTVNDAEALGEVLLKQETGRLYGGGVQIHTLYNEQVTKEGFTRFFEELKSQIQPEDAVVFSYSGHGSVDGKGDFYFAPWDTTGLDNPGDSNIGKQDLVGNLLKLRAKNTLVLLDTCRSGALLEMETAFGRLLERLEQKAILTAALGDQSALEMGKLQHGLFTYTVLQAFEGKAGEKDSRYIGANNLISYVEKAVPDTIEELGLNGDTRALFDEELVVQKPLAKAPAEDFSIIDRYLDPGELSIRSTRSPGTVQIIGGDAKPLPIKAGETVTQKLREGTYTVQLTYADGHAERKDAELVNNGRAEAVFNYRVPTPAPVVQPVAPPPERPAPVPALVRIPGGTFMMGSPASEPERLDNEVQHQVTVSAFYMGKYEVTVGEFRQFANAAGYKTTAETSGGGNVWTGSEWETKADANWKNPYISQGDNHPVVMTSWTDAVNYCNWRSRQEGLTPAYTISGENVTWNRNANGYRLPTEAEWEYACRAGTTTPFSTGNNLTTSQANYNNAKGTTAPVGSFTPNAWGLYDMHGNVLEWCWDWYGNYSGGSQTDPAGVSSGQDRVLRGGSWYSYAENLRSAFRLSRTPTTRNSIYGFRVVRP